MLPSLILYYKIRKANLALNILKSKKKLFNNYKRTFYLMSHLDHDNMNERGVSFFHFTDQENRRNFDLYASNAMRLQWKSLPLIITRYLRPTQNLWYQRKKLRIVKNWIIVILLYNESSSVTGVCEGEFSGRWLKYLLLWTRTILYCGEIYQYTALSTCNRSRVFK